MENPKCPYCGGEQYLTIEDHREIGRMEYYMCVHCGSRSPVKKTTEAAYAAAMKRADVKPVVRGEWETVSESAWDGNEYKCSACGWTCCDNEFGDDPTEDYRFCPNCGADMRKEANDER